MAKKYDNPSIVYGNQNDDDTPANISELENYAEKNRSKPKHSKEGENKDWFDTDSAHDDDEEDEDYEVSFYDPRHPNIDQTRNCFDNYVNAHRCKNIYGEHFNPCQYFEMTYKQICPTDLIEKWDEFVNDGAMPANLN